MNEKLNSIQKFMGSTLGALVLATGTLGLSVSSTQAQVEIMEEDVVVEEIPSDQLEALIAVAKMAEGQRTYYKKNGKFLDEVSELQKLFEIELPSSFNYAVRTTDEAAYNYVIPKDNSSLKAFVGSTFLAPDGSGELTTIICLNKQAGQDRLSDSSFCEKSSESSTVWFAMWRGLSPSTSL